MLLKWSKKFSQLRQFIIKTNAAVSYNGARWFSLGIKGNITSGFRQEFEYSCRKYCFSVLNSSVKNNIKIHSQVHHLNPWFPKQWLKISTGDTAIQSINITKTHTKISG